MSGILCLRGRVGEGGGIVFSRSQTKQMKYVQSQLDKRLKEVEQLKEELSEVEQDKDENLLSQQQYQDIIEAQQAELGRIRERLGLSADEDIVQVKNDREAAKAGGEDGDGAPNEEEDLENVDLETLEEKVRAQRAVVDENQVEIDALRDCTLIDRNYSSLDEEPVSGAGPKAFFKRIELMQKGDMLGILTDNTYKRRFVKLSDDCKTLTIAMPKTPKKPIMTVNLDGDAHTSYPARTSVKKAKKNMDAYKPFMKFAVEGEKVLEILATSSEQLATWYVGLQSLTCDPGEKPMTLGGFCWLKIKARLQTVAIESEMSPLEVMSDVFLETVVGDAITDLKD